MLTESIPFYYNVLGYKNIISPLASPILSKSAYHNIFETKMHTKKN